jgi:tetratricopeptide (TPR) repeat protein
MEEAAQYFDEALRISKSCNDRLSRADSLVESIRLQLASGDFARAIETAQKTIREYRDLGRTRISLGNIMLGNALRLQRESGAEEALQEGLASARALNHRPDIAFGLEGMGSLLLDRKDYAQAQAYFDEAIQLWDEIGNEPEIAVLLCRSAFGLLAAESTDRQAIHEKFTRALHLARRHHAGPVVLTAMVGLAALQLQAGAAGQAAPVLFYARSHHATPAEARGWVERLISQLPADMHTSGAALQPAAWATLVERWVHQLSLT